MGKTVIIIDHAHCGTTMLAGLLEMAGVPMVGTNFKEDKWEDLDIIDSLSSGNEHRFARLVRHRNEQHEIWGFKYAGAWKFMDVMLKYLTNPIFLVIYKDPVAVTMRRFATRDVLIGKLKNTFKQFMEGINGILETRQPVHVFSYEKAVVAPREFVQDLLDIIELDADVDNLAKFIQPNPDSPRKRYPSVKKWLKLEYSEEG